MIKSRKWLKMPKSDKMTKNSVFFIIKSRPFMIKSRKWLKMPKSDKMTKNSVFFHYKKPPVHDKKPQMTKNAEIW